MAKTLYQKVFDAHVVREVEGETPLIYIDRHLVHEVTSPQAFEALKVAGRPVRRPELTLAVPDHNLPTTARIDAKGAPMPIADPESAAQLAALEVNAPAFGIRYIPATAKEQGIQLLVGAQFVFAHSSPFAGQRIALIVKNKTGYTHLCRLITQARSRADKGDYLFTRDDLADIPPGLHLLLIPDERNRTEFPALLAWCSKRFTGRMHLVCSLHNLGFESAWLSHLQSLAFLHQVELLASNLPVMHSSERKALHDVLTAVRHNCSLNSRCWSNLAERLARLIRATLANA